MRLVSESVITILFTIPHLLVAFIASTMALASALNLHVCSANLIFISLELAYYRTPYPVVHYRSVSIHSHELLWSLLFDSLLQFGFKSRGSCSFWDSHSPCYNVPHVVAYPGWVFFSSCFLNHVSKSTSHVAHASRALVKNGFVNFMLMRSCQTPLKILTTTLLDIFLLKMSKFSQSPNAHSKFQCD
jgi:hypothetical protein